MDNLGSKNQMDAMEEIGDKLQDIERDARDTKSAMKSHGDQMKQTTRDTDMLSAATGSAAGGMGRMRSKMLLMGGAIAALLPVVIDLAGALGALIGSLGQAIIGVGALGTALGGALLVGLAGVAGAAIPAIDRLKELKGEFKDMGKEWSDLTGPGQDDFIGMAADSMDRVRAKFDVFADSANRSMAAMRDAVDGFFERLDVTRFDRFVERMTLSFERIADPIMQTIANVGETLSNIAIASAPFMEDMIYSFEKITRGWATSSTDIQSLRKQIGGMVDQARSWVYFLDAAWEVTKSVFGSGADEGQGLVDDMTKKMYGWANWIDNNQESVDGFWAESIQGTKDLAKFLGQLGPPLKNINDAMEPLVWLFEKFVGAISAIKLPGTEISGLTAIIAGLGAAKIADRTGVSGTWGMRGLWRPGSVSNPIAVMDMGMRSPGGGVVPVPGGGNKPAPKPGKPGIFSRMFGALKGGVGGALTVLGATKFGGPILQAGKAAIGKFMAVAKSPLGKFLKFGIPVSFLSNLLRGKNVIESVGGVANDFTLGAAGSAYNQIFNPMTDAERTRQTNQRRRPVRSGNAGEAAQYVTSGAGTQNPNDILAARDSLGERTQGEIARQINGNQLRLGLVTAMEDAAAQVVQRAKRRRQDAAEWKQRVADREAGRGVGINHLRRGNIRRPNIYGNPSASDSPGMGLAPGQGVESVSGGGRTVGEMQIKRGMAVMGEYQRTMREGHELAAQLGDKAKGKNAEVYRNTTEMWQKSSTAMRTAMQNARKWTSEEHTRIVADLRAQLDRLGIEGSQANQAIQSVGGSGNFSGASTRGTANTGGGGGGGTPPGRQATGGRLAGGGRIGGYGNQDKVGLGGGNLGAPGELVVNRHTERDIDRDLISHGKPPIGRRVAGENRPHYMPPPTKVSTKAERERHAAGGRLIPAAGFPSETWNSKIAGPASKLIDKYNLFLTDAYGPGHASTEHTQLGTAIDVVPGPGGSWEQVNAAVADAVSSGYTPVYYDGSGGSINLPPHGPGHHAHITMLTAAEYGAGAPVGVSVGAGGGGGPAPQVNLKPRKSGLKGAPGVVADRISQILTGAAEKRANRKLGGMGGGATGPAGPGTPMGASMYGGPNDPTSGTIGYRGDSLPGTMAFAELGMGEAMGGLPYGARARISYGGKSVVGRKLDIGLGGGDVNGQPRAIDLWHETAEALGFPFGTGIVKVQNLAKGGRISQTPSFGGWYGDGGDFTAHGPMMIGVGEKGSERVTVTPTGKSGPGGVKIGTININNHRKGDIKKQLKEEIEAAFSELTDHVQDDAGVGIV
jgi:hypothetical protein